jgi:hypothetical protein
LYYIELKAAVAKQTEIPPLSQRLIFSGKHLSPDSKLLSEFNIGHEASIHLFPRLISAPPPSEPIENASPGRQRILRIQRMANPQATLFSDGGQGHLRGSLHQTVPEVRLWCYILFFYSFMTIFDHFSYIANTGMYTEMFFNLLF